MGADPAELAEGLWRWTARHPEWHPGDFGSEVASFALDAGGQALLVDPLLPPEPEPVLELVERLAEAPLHILITVPYHVRSAEELRRRHGAAVWGHPAAAKRLADRSGFRPIEPGAELPAGVTAHAIGRPRRHEMPLHLPSHRALVFGDALVEVGGRLRLWHDEPVDDERARWYRERFAPTLEPLLELDFERVLVTHGQPVLERGRQQLEAALRARAWHHHG